MPSSPELAGGRSSGDLIACREIGLKVFLRAKIDVSLMWQPSARPARIARSTADRFKTGSAPGNPIHTGHTCVFGGAPNAVLQPQKILDAVRRCA
jgi:hypothetical protein